MTPRINGDLAAFHHKCELSLIGKPMGFEEQRRFLTRILLVSFRRDRHRVELIHHEEGKMYPDIREYCITKAGVRIIDYIVVPIGMGFKAEDRINLVSIYDSSHITLKVMYCALLSKKGFVDKPINGSIFNASFNPETLYPTSSEKRLTKKLSQRELVEKVISAWENLNADIMSPFFAPNMHYRSDWEFGEMSSSLEYKRYIKDKFKILRNNGSKLDIRLGTDKTGAFAMLVAQKECFHGVAAMDIKVNNGLIVSMHLKHLKQVPKGWNNNH